MDFITGNDCSEWQILGDEDRSVLYQQVTVHEPMGWSGLSLECYKAACAKFSGPIALKWNSDETLPMNCDIALTTDILIYDSCGKKIAQIPGKDWQYTHVITMGWTSTLKLYILFEDGQYIIFSNLGTILSKNKLFEESLTDIVFNASASDDGFVAFTKNNRVIYVNCAGTNPVVENYPDLTIVAGNRVECSCIFEARNNESNCVECLVCCMDQSMYYITPDSITEVSQGGRIQGHLIAMAPSPSNDYIACFSDQGWLDVFDRNFEDHIVGKNTDCRVPPRGFAWCGDDSVVLYWRTVGLLLINPFADWLKYSYDKDDTLFLVPEIDCLRVYSSLKHEIIRCVPTAIANLYLPESHSCGAQLRNSFSQFTHHVGSVSLLRGETHEERVVLREGVMECLEAAGEELSTIQQEELLRSAQFGKCFLDGVVEESNENQDQQPSGETGETGETGEGQEEDEEGLLGVVPVPVVKEKGIVDQFQHVTHVLRVLNTLRDPTISMFLTWKEYEFLGIHTILTNLLYRHFYYLAIKICKYLSIPPDFILIHWACEKIRSSEDLSDEAVRDQIRENLKDYQGISYKEIAEEAFKSGRKHLATMLLEFESRCSDRIPLLLEMDELQLALRSATNSNDSDLIMMVALSLYKDVPEENQSKLIDILKHFPKIFNSWLLYVRLLNPNRYLTIMNSLGRCEEVFHLLIVDAYKEIDLNKRKEALKKIIPIVNTAVSAGHKELQFYVKTIQDEMKLIDFKLQLISSLKKEDCSNLTLTECLHYAILNQKVDIADKMAKTFKVNDKRYWRIKVFALAEAELWDALAIFSEKKSPIGYSPFVEAAVTYHNRNEALLFLKKMSDTEERLRCAMKWHLYEGAVECALRLKDVDSLYQILNQCRVESVKTEARNAIALIEGNK